MMLSTEDADAILPIVFTIRYMKIIHAPIVPSLSRILLLMNFIFIAIIAMNRQIIIIENNDITL